LQSFSQHGADRVDALAEFKFLWLRLSKVTQGLGNCLGLTYGNFTLFSFGLVVSTSYGFLVSLRGGCTVFTHSLLCSSAFFSAMLYSQCASAQSATDEVSNHP
jgi:hypothetical protein